MEAVELVTNTNTVDNTLDFECYQDISQNKFTRILPLIDDGRESVELKS